MTLNQQRASPSTFNKCPAEKEKQTSTTFICANTDPETYLTNNLVLPLALKKSRGKPTIVVQLIVDFFCNEK